eukprot:6466334-Amphidinium_carterae.1
MGSYTIADICLSSGESEFYACLKAASVGLGAQAMLEDFGQPKKLVLRTDSTAAIGILQRRGLGRTRHIATRYLWLQQKVAQKALE